MVRIYVQRRKCRTAQAPVRPLYRQILLAHGQTKDSRERTNKRRVIERLSVNGCSKIEKPAFETQELRNEEIIRYTKPKKRAKSASHDEIENPITLYVIIMNKIYGNIEK